MEFCRKIYDEWNEKLKNLKEICALLNVSFVDTTKLNDELKQMLEDINSRYECLQLLSHWEYGNTHKLGIVTRTINLIDKGEKQ